MEREKLEFTEKGKIALADALIDAIRKQKSNWWVSDDDDGENGARSVHIDYESLEEHGIPGELVYTAIGAACRADGVEFGVD